MPERYYLHKLLKYIKGEVTSREKAEIENWLAKDPVRYDFLNQIKKIWRFRAEDKQDWDVEASWQRFKGQYKQEDTADAFAHRSPPYKIPRHNYASRRSGYRVAYAVAAGIAILAVALFLFWNSMPQQQPQITMQKIITRMGERTNLKLGDGTHIILKGGSEIRIPSNFGQPSRTVYLDGEAYFEVTHNEDKPFRVYVDNVYIEDLGTVFNIKAYENDAPVQVVVAEGLVEVGDSNNPAKGSAIINPNQMGEITPSGKISISKVKDLAPFLGWTKGWLIFKSTPFDLVQKELERKYGLKIAVTDSALYNRPLSARFKNEPLTDILNIISLSLGMDYSRQNGSIIFSPK